jgi:uncharacterized protein YjbI with pentapeptide repeats
MANEEHLKLIRQGLDAWNGWWKERRADTLPDLGGAALHGANLSWAKLRQTQRRQADLTRADLREAHLRGRT